MKVTVTGATGAIGLASVHMLVRAGHEARAFVRSRDSFLDRSSEPRVEVVEGDILDVAATEQALAGADAVIHCVDFPPKHFSLSIDAMRNVLEELPPEVQVIYPSNLSVYAPPQPERVGPKHPKQSPARLGAVKAELEQAVRAAAGTVVRFPEVYGPGVRVGRTARFFERALAGKTVYNPGSLDRALEFLYIGDAARALVAALGRTVARGAEYTAPGSAETTPREFISLIFKAAGQPPRLRHLPIDWLRRFAKLHPGYRATRELLYLYESPILLDGRIIRAQLGWFPEVDYREGIRRSVKWHRDQRTRTHNRAEERPVEPSAVAS